VEGGRSSSCCCQILVIVTNCSRLMTFFTRSRANVCWKLMKAKPLDSSRYTGVYLNPKPGGTVWWERVWKGGRGCGEGGSGGSKYSASAVAVLVPVQLGDSFTLNPKLSAPV
jgi:hypothetical protein